MKDMTYKGYIGTVEVSEQDNCLRGKLAYINDLVTYQTETPAKLRDEFVAAVDDYLATCEELNEQPDRPFKGSFNVRTDPEVHHKLWEIAQQHDTTLNKIADQALALFTRVVEKSIAATPVAVQINWSEISGEIFSVARVPAKRAPAKKRPPAKKIARKKVQGKQRTFPSSSSA